MNTYDQRFAEPLGSNRSGTTLPATTTSAPMALAVPTSLPGLGHTFVLQDIVITAFLRWRLVMLCLLLPILASYLGEMMFHELPLTLRQTSLAGQLPLHHRDPFDRMLIAQSLVEDLTIVSNEDLFDSYGVRRLW